MSIEVDERLTKKGLVPRGARHKPVLAARRRPPFMGATMQHITRRRIQIAYAVLFFVIFADGIAAFAFFMVIRTDATREPRGSGPPLSWTTATPTMSPRWKPWFIMGYSLQWSSVSLWLFFSGAAIELGLGIPVLRNASRRRRENEDTESRLDRRARTWIPNVTMSGQNA